MIDKLVSVFVRLNPILAHAGIAISSIAFTCKMLRDMPNDPLLWGVYMTSVGGVSAMTEWLRARA